MLLVLGIIESFIQIPYVEVAVRRSYVRLFIGTHDDVQIYDAMQHSPHRVCFWRAHVPYAN